MILEVSAHGQVVPLLLGSCVVKQNIMEEVVEQSGSPHGVQVANVQRRSIWEQYITFKGILTVTVCSHQAPSPSRLFTMNSSVD
jgi:hypothetical protein